LHNQVTQLRDIGFIRMRGASDRQQGSCNYPRADQRCVTLKV
jgi:hypothetical protein